MINLAGIIAKMGDIVYVTTEQFKILKEANVGVYLVDSIGVEQIILDDKIIYIHDII